MKKEAVTSKKRQAVVTKMQAGTKTANGSNAGEVRRHSSEKKKRPRPTASKKRVGEPGSSGGSVPLPRPSIGTGREVGSSGEFQWQ